MFILKNDEFVYKAEGMEKVTNILKKILYLFKQLFPCLYYGTYDEDGVVYFGIYRQWFGKSFSEFSFPICYDEEDEYCDEELEQWEDNDGDEDDE